MSDNHSSDKELSARLAALSPAKRALLELRLTRQRALEGLDTPPVILPRRADGPLPLSFAQQRLWFLDQLEPGPQYNVPCRAWLRGALDVPALRRALDTLVARHESLRTTFPSMDGRPVQAIAPASGFELAEADLRGLAESTRDGEVERLAREEARRPFDLARGPLCRGRLLQVAEDEHALLLTLHHIVSDGWSVGILFRELGTLYEAFSLGEPSPLAPLPIQYADYALWQRDWLQGAVLERELAYWRHRFPLAPPPLELPSDLPRPTTRTTAGGRVAFGLSSALTGRLKAVGLQEGATLFMTLLAALKVLLARHTGRDDIVVGTPIAGRSRPETEGVIGCFVNTLALGTDLGGDPSFRELLLRVREVALGAYAHQELPFDRVVEELQPERDLARTPLFQVMFALQNLPRSTRRLRGLTLRHLEMSKGTAKFDLGLSVSERGPEVTGAFTYSTDVYDAAAVRRLAAQYQVLLEGIANDPATRLSSLPLLSDADRGALVRGWAPAPLPEPGVRCIHHLVEEQAARTPDAAAVIFGSERLSYAELDRRATRLAYALCARGARPDAPVALCLERSVGLMVGVLGILKAGSAYLPVDPDAPRERTRTVLADAGVRLLVADEDALRRLGPLPPGIEVVREGAAMPADAERAGDRSAPAGAVSPDQLAYVIYTSGSTGVPKGVAVPHRAVVGFCTTAADTYGISAGDRVLQSASLTSDFSVEEIFPAWIRGAAVVVRPPGPIAPGREFTALLEQGGITIALIPTAFWAAWVDDIDRLARTIPPTLRIVSVGGETARAASLHRWRRRAGPSVRWFNTYGPTEATVEATAHEPVAEREGRADDHVPIGRPLAHARVYLLDRHLEPVPPGVPGELFLGGLGLARGYFRRPAETAAVFLPDPFAGEPGARMYRTGDRGRVRADGTLEFLGRVDAQVKIRGFRVEPGEIEAVVAGHPGIRQAVILPVEEAVGERRLVGYIVPAPGETAAPAGLRAWLQERLPEAMVPATWVVLDRIPLTPAGKLDRAELPAPGRDRAASDEPYVAPRNDIEAIVADIWTAVLHIERVGAHDNFFAAGGHSLLATQLIARIRAATGIELPLRALFEAPTVAGLAERLEAGRRLLEEIATLAPDEVSARLREERVS